MALLYCEELTLGYDSRVIVQELSFSVNTGDYLCIVGENGAGKTTLIKTLLGLLRPMEGAIRYGEGFKARELGYLPQQSIIQKDFPASVREVVLSGCQGRGGRHPFYSKADRRNAAENMEKMGVGEFAGRCYRELSGGQQQRVLLARALCAARRVLLLDEPAAGLDPRMAAELYQLINQLNREEGVTIIIISHDLSAVIRYASHILHVGKPVFFGEKEAYLQSEVGKGFTGQEGGRVL